MTEKMETDTQGTKGTGMYVFIDEKSGKFLNSHFSGLTEELGEALRLDDSTPMKIIVKGFMENLPKGGVGIVAHEIRYVPVLRF